MEGMGLIFTLVLVTRLLGPLGLSGLMTSNSWTQILQTVLLESVTHLWLPTHPTIHLPPTHPPLIRAIHDIAVVVKNLHKIQQC